MLCTCYRGGQWHWLSAEGEPQTGRLVLLERRGACPGDPDGTVVRLLGFVDVDALPGKAAAWLRHGWAAAAGDSRPTGYLPPAQAAVAIAADPGGRRLGGAAAQAVVEASVRCAERPFCVFPNPAARAW